MLKDGSEYGVAVTYRDGTRNDGAERGDAVRRKLAHTDGMKGL